MKTYSRIAGTGSYLPQRVVTNSELESRIETSDEWIVSRTGIEARHVAADEEMTSDLALQAARAACSARSLVISSSAATWRASMPVRDTIHSSLVSIRLSSSLLVTTRCGR